MSGNVPNYWIFVISDSRDVFADRLDGKRWPLFPNTRYKRQLSSGDRIVFYEAGMDGQRFLGTCTIASLPYQIKGKMDSFLDLDDISVWSGDRSIRPLIGKLDFITDPVNWGASLQGGVIKISRGDYCLISSL